MSRKRYTDFDFSTHQLFVDTNDLITVHTLKMPDSNV